MLPLVIISCAAALCPYPFDEVGSRCLDLISVGPSQVNRLDTVAICDDANSVPAKVTVQEYISVYGSSYIGFEKVWSDPVSERSLDDNCVTFITFIQPL